MSTTTSFNLGGGVSISRAQASLFLGGALIFVVLFFVVPFVAVYGPDFE